MNAPLKHQVVIGERTLYITDTFKAACIPALTPITPKEYERVGP